MDTIGEEVKGVDHDNMVKPLETFTKRDDAERKVTYKSFKYVTICLHTIAYGPRSSDLQFFTKYPISIRISISGTVANMSHSFRKKYKKMKIKFDEAMRISNKCCVDEQKGLDTAKRLAIENE
jgi:hypothetical protein